MTSTEQTKPPSVKGALGVDVETSPNQLKRILSLPWSLIELNAGLGLQ